jgi:hypothetical protein
MQGLYQQRHFPAVAQPFRILWAPWAPSLAFVLVGLLLSVLGAAILGPAIGGVLLPVGLVGGHATAIAVGLRMQFMATLVAGLENHRRGTTNLSAKKAGQYEFANL